MKIKYADFQIVTRSRTSLETLTARPSLERISLDLVRTVFPLRKSIRLLGVSLSNLHARDEAASPQLALEL